jgi:hypothetical protein
MATDRHGSLMKMLSYPRIDQFSPFPFTKDIVFATESKISVTAFSDTVGQSAGSNDMLGGNMLFSLISFSEKERAPCTVFIVRDSCPVSAVNMDVMEIVLPKRSADAVMRSLVFSK